MLELNDPFKKLGHHGKFSIPIGKITENFSLRSKRKWYMLVQKGSKSKLLRNGKVTSLD